MSTTEKQLKVSASTPAKQFAGCLVSCVENREPVEVRAVGAGAVNQMFKAVAIASSILASKGLELLIKAGFDDFEENGVKRTAMIARTVVR